MRNYLNCMNRLDEGIGLVLADLEKLKMRDNTLVIYMADHGGDFPRGKTTCYEGGVKVPMIVNFPSPFRKGTRNPPWFDHGHSADHPSGSRHRSSRSPRRCSSASLAGPASSTPQVHPHLQYRLLGQHSPPDLRHPRRTLQAHLQSGSHHQYGGDFPIPKFCDSQSLWNPEYIDSPEFELYDLHKDPYELKNLANDAALLSTRNELFQAMRDFQKEIGDPFLDPENVKFYIEEMQTRADIRKSAVRKPGPISKNSTNSPHSKTRHHHERYPQQSLAEATDYFEYTSAANPRMPKIDIEVFPASMHQIDETKLIPLDLSAAMETSYPCTGPSLLANYLHINPGDSFVTKANSLPKCFSAFAAKAAQRPQMEL